MTTYETSSGRYRVTYTSATQCSITCLDTGACYHICVIAERHGSQLNIIRLINNRVDAAYSRTICRRRLLRADTVVSQHEAVTLAMAFGEQRVMQPHACPTLAE